MSSPVGAIFAPGGRLEAAHPAYERREGQEAMALAVEAALGEGKRLLIEAGTGIGKTLAYLVPAALSDRRVIVSTGTKNLQDQIIEKDLPFLVERLGIPVTAAVLKGRENYLCLRRMKEFDREPLLPSIQESETYETLRAWARTTETGDRSEAAGLPEESSFWRKINARGDTCTGTRCPDFESCWLTRARRRAEQARIVIVNHHLFFADLALREDAFGKVLPDYDSVVFDEAHLLEEVATLFFGVSCSSGRVMELADDADRILGAGSFGGREGSVAPSEESRDAERYEEAPRRRPRARRRGSRSGRRGTDAAEDGSPEAAHLRRATAAFFGPLAAPSRRALDARLRGELFDERLTALRAAIDMVRAGADRISPVTDESASLARRCREIDGQLAFIATGTDERYVHWAEQRGRSIVLTASPIDVSELLAQTLFDGIHAAILTSATLSVGGSFAFVRERLGIGEAEERVVPSPFDYPTQTVLYLPAAMPEPRGATWPERMLREVEALLGISRGRAFLLFTSHAELRRVEESLRGRTRHPILVQGEKPRARLLEEFRATPGAILLGAASFWHGVDVVGDALSLVVIDKIPFDVPSDPLIAARIERIRALGGEPFTDYQVPAAAIEMKQGLGRLIRSRADRGILCVLDGRLRGRGYGRRLLEALPPFPIVSDIEQVRAFFERS